MIRHCVMFTWNEGVTDETVRAVSDGLSQFAELDVTLAYHHGPDAGVSEGNWEYVVVGDFATVEDYRTYATDPAHVELIAELIRPNISARAAVQYEIAD